MAMIDTLEKRQAALSVSTRIILPFPSGVIDSRERYMLLSIYAILAKYPLTITITENIPLINMMWSELESWAITLTENS